MHWERFFWKKLKITALVILKSIRYTTVWDCERNWIFTETKNSSNDEVSKVDESLVISKVNITEKKWNDMNAKDVSSTTEKIYSTTTTTPN